MVLTLVWILCFVVLFLLFNAALLLQARITDVASIWQNLAANVVRFLFRTQH